MTSEIEIPEEIPPVVRDWTFYDEAGRVVANMSCDTQNATVNMEIGLYAGYMEGWFPPNTHYFAEDSMKARPDSLVSIEGNVLLGVPDGADVIIDGTRYKANGEDIELSFSTAGRKSILVRAFPAKDWQGIYDAN